MSYFKNVILVKAPQKYELPQPLYVSDLIEVCSLAAMIEQDVDSVQIPVDFNSSTAYQDFERHLANNPVDLVAISSMTGAYTNAIKMAEMAKKAGKFVVMGGYHPSAMSKEVLESPFVDVVVIGEGELTFKDLVLHGPSKDVTGIAFKKDGTTTCTPPRPLIKDLDALPLPLRKARPMRFGEKGDDYSIDTVYTSRGCPYHCSFCANDIVNGKWRARSPENIVKELSLLHHPKRTKIIKLWDANFLTSVKRIEKLCDLMIEKGLTNFKINIETSVDDIIRAEPIMEKLRKVGIHHIGIGIESPNEETLKLMRKKAKADSCARAVDILNRNNIKSQGFFIIGHYIEDEEETKKYPLYANSLGLRQAVFMVMTPYPGTDVFKEYSRENKIKNKNWEIYNNFGSAVTTMSMGVNDLKRMLAYCWGNFYIRFAFFHNSKPLGVVANVVQKISMLYHIYLIDKTNTKPEIKDYLFAYLESAIGEYSRKEPRKKSFALKHFSDYTVRFEHSPGKAIDFTFWKSKGMIQLGITRENASETIRGMTVRIDDIMTLGDRVTPNHLVAVASKFDIIKGLKKSPSLKRKKYLLICYDKNILVTVISLLRFALPILAGQRLFFTSSKMKFALSKKIGKGSNTFLHSLIQIGKP